MENRTDLALESYENQRKTVLPGVKVREQDGISVVEVLDARGEKALGKPVGKYITYRVSPMAQETQLFDGRLERIADLLRGLLPDHPTGVLVAGVGNTAITADALGPETNRYVLATRHIAGELRRALGPLTDVSTVTTGVLGNTGMESAEVVAGMVHTVRPDCVLVVTRWRHRRRIGWAPRCSCQMQALPPAPGWAIIGGRSVPGCWACRWWHWVFPRWSAVGCWAVRRRRCM